MRFGLGLVSFGASVVLLTSPSLGQPADPAHALAQKFAEEPKRKTPPSAVPSPAPGTAPTLGDDEAEMLRAARAEAEARRKSEQTAIARPAQPVRIEAPAVSPPAPTAPQRIEIKVRAQVPHLSIAAQSNETKPATPPAPAAAPGSAAKATALIVLLHGANDPASLPKSPDPILCLGDDCYVSTGAATDARLVSRTDALSTKNVITDGAGACKGKDRCAYRGITLKTGAALQIVDLGLVHHDRREPVEANIDASCKMDEGDLVCDHPVNAADYRIWLVPEQVASGAGADKLDAALADDLPEENIVRDDDK